MYLNTILRHYAHFWIFWRESFAKRGSRLVAHGSSLQARKIASPQCNVSKKVHVQNYFSYIKSTFELLTRHYYVCIAYDQPPCDFHMDKLLFMAYSNAASLKFPSSLSSSVSVSSSLAPSSTSFNISIVFNSSGSI